MIAVEIRPATATDRAGWIEMRYELWPQCPLERHQLEIELLLNAPGVVALASVDHQPVGFAEISIRKDHVEGTSISPVPYLEGWYVRPQYRGAGVGGKLIAYAEKWAREHGFNELASDAELENTLSIALHGKLGFREVGRGVHFVKSLRVN